MVRAWLNNDELVSSSSLPTTKKSCGGRRHTPQTIVVIPLIGPSAWLTDDDESTTR